jgi:hypothetical protein
MTDTPPEFAKGAFECARPSSGREAGGKEFAKV